MIKLSKKIIATMVSSFTFIVFSPISASAATLDFSGTANSDEIVIYLDSEQELVKLNALAEQKWQEALERSDTEVTIFEDIHTRGFASLNSRMSTYQNSYGTPFFKSINSVTFKSEYTNKEVEDFTYQTVMLDASRTCAVNGSCFVLVSYGSDNARRYPVTIYKEFYASQNY